MSNNPLNLALRFVLELAALAALAYWGWAVHDGIWAFVWAIGLPLVAAVFWGTFRVPGDPGNAPVPVPGALRLLLELAVFGGAVWLLAAAGQPTIALVFGVILVLHYLASLDRIGRLLRSR